MADLETALRADLERWGEEVARTALAAAALDTARRLDAPKVSAASASLLHGQLRQYLSDLRELDVDTEGSIAIEHIDSAISSFAEAAERAASGHPGDAVIWEEVESRTSENIELNGVFLAFMALACLIASVGIFLDSPILIVGAMIVGPEFGPIAGLCVALVQRRPDVARRSLRALAIGERGSSIGEREVGRRHERAADLPCEVGRRRACECGDRHRVLDRDVPSLVIERASQVAAIDTACTRGDHDPTARVDRVVERAIDDSLLLFDAIKAPKVECRLRHSYSCTTLVHETWSTVVETRNPVRTTVDSWS